MRRSRWQGLAGESRLVAFGSGLRSRISHGMCRRYTIACVHNKNSSPLWVGRNSRPRLCAMKIGQVDYGVVFTCGLQRVSDHGA